MLQCQASFGPFLHNSRNHANIIVEAIKPLFVRSRRRSEPPCGPAVDNRTALEKETNVEEACPGQNSKSSPALISTTNDDHRGQTSDLRRKPKLATLRHVDSWHDFQLPPLRFIPTGSLHLFSFSNMSHISDSNAQTHLDDRSINNGRSRERNTSVAED